ncbi:phosphatidylglycerol lysyltransferase [Azospirillum sp. RU38E]|nr:phosphatidylglycerol lysyltransferase [Azospirillum sp. RU38E]SNS66104.1 phosphatidylglycerol lysyltransferase [Azospirillum sp. RU37A]
MIAAGKRQLDPVGMRDDHELGPEPASRRPHLRTALTALAVLAVAAAGWFAATRLANEISYDEVMEALRATPLWAIGAALGMTGASFLALTFYDRAALAWIGRPMPSPTIMLASFCAYAVGNTAGFGPLTAGAIRYRFYTPHGLEPEEVARIIAFVTATFGLGLAATTGLGLLIAGDIAALGLPGSVPRLLGIAILAGLGLLIWLAGHQGSVQLGKTRLVLPKPRLMLGQMAAAIADIAAAGSALWLLLPGLDIGWTGFIAVYAVAVGLGVLSHVPAGLGVFETVILAALGSRVDTEQVLGALLLYRVIYHVVPLLLAGLVVSVLETRRAALAVAGSRLGKVGGRMAPPVLGTLALVLSAMLIFSGVTPAADGNLELLSDLLPLPLLEGAHFLSSILGLGLFIVARGLVYRLDGAWWAAVAMLPVAILLSLAKGLALTEACLLASLLLLLLFSRRRFDRRSSLLHQTLTIRWLLAVGVLLLTALTILFFVYKDVEYAHGLWWQFEFSEEAPRSLRAMLGVGLLAGMAAALSLLGHSRVRSGPAGPEELARARTIVDAQPRTGALLALLGDKSLLFSDDGRAFIMYGCQGRSWIALFDPVGPRDAWPQLVWRFVEMARAAGGRAVFYEVAPENLALYADAGLAAFKLGEDAFLDLPSFDLKGSKRANQRNALNRGERDGLVFDIIPTEAVPAAMAELQAVSDDWLEAHEVREKRFSLGAFEPDYLALRPVAVLRRDGAIVAFANLMSTDLKEEISIDLMRFSRAAPPGAMEYLLLRLILLCKEQGYQRFNLGMAPLAGLSDSNAASIWHRVGRAVYDHGDRFYNFSGLRAFKSKFQPRWEARYMAVSGGINPMLALADVTVLISGGLRGVVGK